MQHVKYLTLVRAPGQMYLLQLFVNSVFSIKRYPGVHTVHSPTRPKTNFETQHQTVSALFHQAAAAGRTTLDQAELATLLAGLGLALAAGSSLAAQPGAIEISIKLYHTREFGLIIS